MLAHLSVQVDAPCKPSFFVTTLGQAAVPTQVKLLR
jgi:hypothetical protein